MRGKSDRLALALVGVLWGTAAGAAGWNPHAPQGATAQLEAARETIATFKATDPGLEVFFQKAYGYAVFPTIGSGGYWFSGAYGQRVTAAPQAADFIGNVSARQGGGES